MRVRPVLALVLLLVATSVTAEAQQIEKVPASQANIARPDDLFNLPQGQWHMAKSLALGSDPCEPTQCEAGFNGGTMVVSVEHAKTFVLVTAAFAMCENVAFSEVEVGDKPGKSKFGQVEKVMKKVVKGLAKTCKMTAPEVPRLDVAALFPKPAA